ncbi:hypothetical protein CLU83_1745 [Flavobacterium sp. 1]|nr:hypothetical protein CLU83_1745 [Flavobacterium sp. 1]
MKLLQYFFQKRMVLILFLIFILINLFSNRCKHFGINKTVGWAWDINMVYLSPLIFLIFFYVFLLAYGIIAFSKRKTNLKLSILHTAIILASAVLMEINEIEILMVCNILSFTVFSANLFGTFKNYKHSH